VPKGKKGHGRAKSKMLKKVMEALIQKKNIVYKEILT
jgi:hypothetical protein